MKISTISFSFPDGTHWEIPVDFIVQKICAYSEYLFYEHELGFIAGDGVHSNSDLVAWATKNLEWEDVRNYAKLVYVDPESVDYDISWKECEKNIR